METNLSEIKGIAKVFLRFKPAQVPDKNSIFVSHPFFNSLFFIEPQTSDIINLLENPKKFEIYLNYFEQHIDNTESVFSIYTHITNPYKLAFFKYIQNYLSEEDYAVLLKDSWISTEWTMDTTNVTNREKIKWFKTAKKEFLMSKSDCDIFNSLNDNVTAYRGVYNNGSEYGISWTLSKSKAEWFASRFSNEQKYLYKCIFRKKDILAYINDRNEQEIIVDIFQAKKYCKIEKIN